MVTTLFTTPTTSRWTGGDASGAYYLGGAKVGTFQKMLSCTLAMARRRDGRWEKRVCISPAVARQWVEEVGC